MTYEEAFEIGQSVFEEYMPKTRGRSRSVFLEEFLSELENAGALSLEHGSKPVLDDDIDVDVSRDD